MVGGVLLPFLLLEIGLRAGGWWWVRQQAERNAATLAADGELVVLCVGESTTAMGRRQSYPRILERRLRKNLGTQKVRVVNGGQPGISTDDIVERMPRFLERWRPDVVVTMMGINDSVVPPREAQGAGTRAWESLRVVKFVRLLIDHLRTRDRPPALPPPPPETKVQALTGEFGMRAEETGTPIEDLLAAEEKLLRTRVEASPGGSPEDWDRLLTLWGIRGAPTEMCDEGVTAYMRSALPPDTMVLVVGSCRHLAVQATKAGDYEGALDRLDQALEALPPDRAASLRAQVYLQQAAVQDAMGLNGEPLRILAMQLEPDGITERTRANYLEVARQVEAAGADLIVSQYPLRSIMPLRDLFGASPDVLFVDNGPNFREAIEEADYWRFFRDSFAGDFGHFTAAGARLVAENVSETIEAWHEERPPSKSEGH